MEEIHPVARYVATRKHWQLFVVFLFYAMIALVIVEHQVDFTNPRTESLSLVLALAIPFAVGAYLWIWSIGHISNKCCPDELRRSDRLFNLVFPLAIIYLLIALFVWPSLFGTDQPAPVLWVILPAHYICTLLVFYGLAQSAMRLRTVEQRQRVGFWRALGTLFLIWYFPIGVWFIQPRLRDVIERL